MGIAVISGVIKGLSSGRDSAIRKRKKKPGINKSIQVKRLISDCCGLSDSL